MSGNVIYEGKKIIGSGGVETRVKNEAGKCVEREDEQGSGVNIISTGNEKEMKCQNCQNKARLKSVAEAECQIRN